MSHSHPISEIEQYISQLKADGVKIFAEVDENSCIGATALEKYENAEIILQKERLIKSQSEIAMMSKASEITHAAFNECQTSNAPTEGIMAAKFEYECKIRGAEHLAYTPVVASGKNALVIHYVDNSEIEKDINVFVEGKELQIHVKKEITESVQEYLVPKLRKGISINKTLPKGINLKKFSHTIKNGILEIVFLKK